MKHEEKSPDDTGAFEGRNGEDFKEEGFGINLFQNVLHGGAFVLS